MTFFDVNHFREFIVAFAGQFQLVYNVITTRDFHCHDCAHLLILVLAFMSAPQL
jgi:hypothetical protein